MNPREHIAAALDFLELADSPIAQQNSLLRSELSWCAAAHAVKAAAKQEGWRNRSHDDLFHVIERLERNLNNTQIILWFKHASRLHRNMYEGDMSNRAIAEGRSRVQSLVHLLEALVN